MKKLLLVILLLSVIKISAQNETVSSGNSITTTEGSISYTVGQILYSNTANTNGSIEQGLQQSYTISQTLGIQETSISLNMIAFPNPTTNTLQLSIQNHNRDLHYSLNDITGKTIDKQRLVASKTTIDLQSYPSATYFLNIYNQSNLIKTFKIIKN